MLSDSCLNPFLLSMARERSAGYKRRDPHPPCNTHPHTFTPTPLQSPFPHSVQRSLQWQQRRLITVKHIRLLCNSFSVNVANKWRGWKEKHTNRKQQEHNNLFSAFCMGKQRKDPYGVILSFIITVNHNICIWNGEHQPHCMQTQMQQQ